MHPNPSSLDTRALATCLRASAGEFPGLEAPLRDGRLSLTTAVTLRPVLTRENLGEMVARAAYKTDEETRHLVATLQPRPAEPRTGGSALAGESALSVNTAAASASPRSG